MRQIIDAPINAIAINPYRRLHAYPYIESKIDALQRSIADVGLWPSVIARPLDDRLWKYELAFGHHRMEAARRSGLSEISLIVEDLTDMQMLQYMGRENLEDYNASFLIQLESWEAASQSGLIGSLRNEREPQSIDIAKMLGWTLMKEQDGRVPIPIMNATARACAAAYALIQGGYNTRDDFIGLNVNAAQNLAERAFSRIEQIEKVGRESNRSRLEIERTKEKYGRSVTETAAQVREGSLPQRDIRSRVDFNAMARTKGEAPSPLFAVFANAVADNLKRTLSTDSDAEKLAEIERVLGQISLLEDWEALRRLDVELLNLARRAEGWQKRLIPSKEKVVQLQRLEAKGGNAS
jgi:hypothetical protein